MVFHLEPSLVVELKALTLKFLGMNYSLFLLFKGVFSAVKFVETA